MVYQRYLNLDKLLNSTSGGKIVLNDLSLYDKDTMAGLPNLLSSIYEVDVLNTLPVCDCGETKKARREGTICKTCGTEVLDPFGKISINMWLKSLTTSKLMSPEAWGIVRRIIGGSNDMLRWLSDTSYTPPKNMPGWVQHAVAAMGGVRTYDALIENFIPVLTIILNSSQFRVNKNKVEQMEIFIENYEDYKADMFSTYLPLPSKRLFVMEKTPMGNYTNLLMGNVIDITMSYIKAAGDSLISPRRLSNITAATISKLANVYDDLYKNFLGRKPGLYRKHVYATRNHFSGRSVITSIVGPHRFDELHLPWLMGIVCFRPHLLNKLEKRGMPYKQADVFLIDHIHVYNPLLDELLKELVSESGFEKGIPVGFERNPSLHKGSVQRQFVTKFKTDPTDWTTSVSLLIAVLLNADIDGDALNMIVLLDNFLANELEPLAPEYSVPSLGSLYNVSNRLTVQGTANATISNYLSKKERDD